MSKGLKFVLFTISTMFIFTAVLNSFFSTLGGYEDDPTHPILVVQGKSHLESWLLKVRWFEDPFLANSVKASFIPYSSYKGKLIQTHTPFILSGDRVLYQAQDAAKIKDWLGSSKKFDVDHTYPDRSDFWSAVEHSFYIWALLSALLFLTHGYALIAD